MTTKRKVRRPKELRGIAGAFDWEYGGRRIDFYTATNAKQTKRLIRWLTQAVAWLEQEKSK